ncbi:Coiled-coil domain-containing protein 180, partial [Geodia barretti]
SPGGCITYRYKEFREVLSEQVGAGPETVARCLLDYDTALCGYLGVARNPPPSSPKNKKGKVASRAKAGSKKSKKATPTDPAPKPSLAGIVEEVVVRGGAVRFYVVGVTENSTGVFLTQNEECEGAPHGIANQALPLSREKYTQARASLRVVYLDHLEMWRGEVRGEEEREAREKEEEARGELDLRMHLHRPRQSRISRDIQRVRAAELEAHRDRIGRHARAVASEISEVRARGGTASDSMGTEEDEYRQKMEDLARSLAQITSSVGLQQVEKMGKHLLEKRLERVEKIGSEVKTSIQTSLSELSSANTAFRASLKLFSEAGNYCPEEVELFSHRLERLAGKLSVVGPQVLATVAQASSAHSQAATNTFSQFYNKYHLYWSDVCHLEEVKKSLTTLQLSVRSVVADSNLQASRLHDDITRTREQLESGDHTHLLESVPLLVTLLTQRIVYLHCRATVQQEGGSEPHFGRGGGWAANRNSPYLQ